MILENVTCNMQRLFSTTTLFFILEMLNQMLSQPASWVEGDQSILLY